MGTKKRLLVSLVMTMALVMMMSSCAMALPMPSITDIDVTNTATFTSVSDWDAFWADSSLDNDLIDMDKSELEVEVDVDEINAASNSGNIVNDSEGVLIVGIDNIDIALTSTIDRSYNNGSFNVMYAGSGNTTVIGSMNTTTVNTTMTDKEFCDNVVTVDVDNVLNDNSVTNITKNETDVNVEFEGIGNTVGSYNDAFCGNDSYSTDITNIKSFNDDCDFNGNDLDVDLDGLF